MAEQQKDPTAKHSTRHVVAERHSLVDYVDAATGETMPPRFLGYAVLTITEAQEMPTAYDEAAQRGIDTEEFLEG